MTAADLRKDGEPNHLTGEAFDAEESDKAPAAEAAGALTCIGTLGVIDGT
jgi:hypothetical protein